MYQLKAKERELLRTIARWELAVGNIPPLSRVGDEWGPSGTSIVGMRAAERCRRVHRNEVVVNETMVGMDAEDDDDEQTDSDASSQGESEAEVLEALEALEESWPGDDIDEGVL